MYHKKRLEKVSLLVKFSEMSAETITTKNPKNTKTNIKHGKGHWKFFDNSGVLYTIWKVLTRVIYWKMLLELYFKNSYINYIENLQIFRHRLKSFF